jgi:hypothetical protein
MTEGKTRRAFAPTLKLHSAGIIEWMGFDSGAMATQ